LGSPVDGLDYILFVLLFKWHLYRLFRLLLARFHW
jgi:hypothetical protein